MRTAPIALLLGAALLTGACSEVEQAVGEAADQATQVVETARYCAQAVQVAQAIDDRDVDAAVSAGRELVEVAPPELVEDARIVLEAAERAQGGDLSALQDEQVQAAADRLRTATEQTCDPTS